LQVQGQLGVQRESERLRQTQTDGEGRERKKERERERENKFLGLIQEDNFFFSNFVVQFKLKDFSQVSLKLNSG
jgi:hypothetical protein